MRQNVIGLGVGLTQALLLLSVGGQVFGVDGQKVVVELIEGGEAGFSPSGLKFGVGAISARPVNHRIV